MSRKQNIEAVLNKFGKYVVAQARANLTRKNQNTSKTLWQSLGYDLTVHESGNFSMSFKMEDYGQFQDQGVKGNKSTYPESKGSPFQYRDKMPPKKAFANWAVRKGLEGTRNEKGQFVSRQSLQYALAKSIQQKGIRATKFFSRPFGMAFENLPPDVTQAFALTEEDFKKFTTQ